jgi:4-amino-4-deoxy-L-arabinose transferase-like glycosyltransferase
VADNPWVRTPVVAALAALLFAAAVRLPGLGARGLASAEQAAFVESQGLSTTALVPTGRPLAPDALPRRAAPLPLGATGLALWARVAGTSETALRLPSALSGVLAAALAALFVVRLAGPRAAAWAGGLVALSPIHALASRTVGPEAPLLLVMLLTLLLLAEVESSGSAAHAAGLGLAVGLLAVSGVAALAALALLPLVWLALRADRRPATGVAFAVALVAVATTTRLGLARSPLDYGEIPSWVPDTTLGGVVRCAGASFTRVAGLEYQLLVPQARYVVPLTALFVALMASGAARLPNRWRGLLVTGAALPFLLGLALALAMGRVTPLQAGRLVAALPFVAALTASGLALLRGWRLWTAGAAAGGAVAVFLALALARPGLDTSPTRAVAREVARCRAVVVAVQRPLDLLSLAAWGVPGPFVLRAPGAPPPAGPAVAVGPSSACARGGATCGALPPCAAD